MFSHKEKSPPSPIPAALNLSLAGAHILLNVYQLFLLPIYLLPLSVGWAVTLVPIAVFNNSFWSLIHEAIHDLFSPSRRINSAAGRLLSLFFGSPFLVLRLSHLLHHKLNRTPIEGTELYDSAKRSWARASIGYYGQILGGLYLFEVLSPLPLFLPRNLLRRIEQSVFKPDTLSGNLVRSLVKDEAVREIRLDGCAIFLLFCLSVICYGGNWPLLAGVFLVRGFLISFLDNVYHYRTPVNDVFYADNLWLPKFLSASLLHFNLHGVHHRNPAVPWTKLPQVFGQQMGKFQGGYFAAALRQLSGPLGVSEIPRKVSTMSG